MTTQLRPAYPSFDAHGKRAGRIAEVTMTGDFDLEAMGGATRAVAEALTAPAPAMLLVDLSGVTFMSSSGLSVLLDAQRRARALGIGLRIFAAAESAARRTLELTGLDAVLPLYASRSEATEDIPRPREGL